MIDGKTDKWQKPPLDYEDVKDDPPVHYPEEDIPYD